MPNRKWTQDMVSHLIDGKMRGMSSTQIADELGLTDQQVRNKWSDMSRNKTTLLQDYLTDRELTPEELRLANQRAVTAMLRFHPEKETRL